MWEEGTKLEFWQLLMNGTKDEHCSSSSKDQKWAETCVAGGGVQKARFFFFYVLEREGAPSL